MKDDRLIKDPKVGNGDKGGNFLFNLALTMVVSCGLKDQLQKAEKAKWVQASHGVLSTNYLYQIEGRSSLLL